MTASLFFFNDTATTEIYTLSLHDALPISKGAAPSAWTAASRGRRRIRPHSCASRSAFPNAAVRSEEHTSELQSPCNLVCRLLLEKKKLQHLCERSSSFMFLLARRIAILMH